MLSSRCSSPFAVWTSDARGLGLQASGALVPLLGPLPPAGLVAWLALAQADDDPSASDLVSAALAAGSAFQLEVPMRGAAGGRHRLLLAGQPVGPAGTGRGYQGFMLDIGAQHSALEAALRTAAQDRLLVTHSTDLIAHCDAQGRYVSISPSYSRLIGWSEEDLVGRPVIDLLHPDDQAPAAQALAHLFGGGVVPDAVEVRKRHRDGHYVTVGTKACGVTDAQGRCIGAVLVSRDITRDKARLKDLETRAMRDPLTRLPNRTWVEHHIAGLQAQACKDTRSAVLFIDLNGFKAVNDRAGHAAGDALLQQVAQRLQCCLRPGDAVARLGGDEFVVATRCADPVAAAGIAQRLLDGLQQPFCLQGSPVRIGAAIGICLAAEATDSPALLLERADLAMYQAKASATSAFRFFSGLAPGGPEPRGAAC